MKTIAWSLVLAVSGVSLMAGCGEAPHRISESEGVTTVNNVNIQDWDEAAAKISQKVKESGKVVAKNGPVAVVGVQPFVNNTTDPELKMDVLIDKICTVLTDANKIQAIDPAAAQVAYNTALARWEAADKAALMNGQPRVPQPQMGPSPDYLLSGSITQLTERAGDVNQSTFIFHLVLSDTATGLKVWQGQTQISKASKRPGIGF